MARSVVIVRTPTGGLQAPLGHGMHLVWNGPGSTRLFLATDVQLIPVEPARFEHDGTARGARRAMRAFIEEDS